MCQSVNEGQRWQNEARESLSGDELTTELVFKAKRGNRLAVDALMRRCLPPLRRWAHGKLPVIARGQLDTCDLVQEVALRTLGRLQSFEVRHAYGMQAYLRQGVMNRIRDELRRRARRPRTVAVPDDLRSTRPSPLAEAIEMDEYRRYRRTLRRLGLKDRQLVVARLERGWSHQTIAARLRLPSVPAANMAVSRAVKRLAHHLACQTAASLNYMSIHGRSDLQVEVPAAPTGDRLSAGRSRVASRPAAPGSAGLAASTA